MRRGSDQQSHNTIIWQYRNFADFVAILQHKALWFSRIDSLKDPFEARYDYPFLFSFARSLEDYERTGCVNCWTMDSDESELMWHAYAPHYGVAIRSTIGKLQRSIIDYADDVQYGSVRYDFKPGKEIPRERPPFRKKRHFRAEREYRAFLPPDSTREITLPGMLVRVDLNILITALWVSPYSPEWFESLVTKEKDMYGLHDIKTARRRTQKKRQEKRDSLL